MSHVVPFPADLPSFYRPWYDHVVLLGDGLAKTAPKAFTAQIVIKKGGAIVHREAETFDRKQAANAWIVKREAELKKPGGLERKEDPNLSAVIDRYTAEFKNAVLGTKAQVLKTIKISDLGERKCSDITNPGAGFSDLTGKLDVLRVSCDKCGQDGSYRLNGLIEKRGRDAKLIDWLD